MEENIVIAKTIIRIGYFFIAIAAYTIAIYNVMLSRKNKAQNAYSSLDVVLKKRYDLIPNLVTVVKQYTKHENATLKELVRLRTELLKDNQYKNVANMNEIMNESLNNIFVYAEKYPELQSSEQYLELQKNLTDIENHISAARRTYNAHVTKYNNTIQIFPNSIFAHIFKFDKLEWFEFKEDESVGIDFDRK